MSKDRAIVAQCAFKGAIELCVAEKIQMSEIMDYTYKYADAMWDKYGFESYESFRKEKGAVTSDRPASDKQKSFVSSLFNKLTIQQQQQYKDKVDTNSMTISDASDFIQTFQDLIEKQKNTPVNLDDAPPF